jgi:hypothetical protein
LEEAIELHETSKKNRRSLADARASLAVAYFRTKRFEEAEKSHFSALDAYRDLYGDGASPYTQGMLDIEELLEEIGLGELGESVKKMIQGFTNADADKPQVSIDVEQYKATHHIMNISASNSDTDLRNFDDEDRETIDEL